MHEQPSDATLDLLRRGASQDDRILGDDSWIESMLDELYTHPTHNNLDELVRNFCDRREATETTLASLSRARRNSRI